MCGIVGIVENKDQRELVEKMCYEINHRGPDGNSQYQHKSFSMGHVRLSVIDLHTGDQPIYNEDKSLSITFNGEIYNYKEIREALILRGHYLSTKTDTEVILHLFEEKGVECFKDLNGYFSFALCDHKNDELYLVRDQFGIKPLYYYSDKDKFIYGSEIKAILLDKRVQRRLNYKALHSQLNLRYNQFEETLFCGIKKLEPGSYLKVDLSCNFSINRYYNLSYTVNSQMTEDDAIDGIRYHLKNAVKTQMVSDVPVGLYLSGGIDSGSLVALAAKESSNPIRTFTLGFNEPTDEFVEAKRVSDMYGTNHTEIRMSPNPMELMEKVIWHAEEPKINLLQGYMMSEALKKDVTVALSGLGGDELFCGYDIYSYTNPLKSIFNAVPTQFETLIGKPLSKLVFGLGSIMPLKFDEYRRGAEMMTSVGNLRRFYLILRNSWEYNKSFYKKIYHPNVLDEITESVDSLFKVFETKGKALERIQHFEFETKMVNDYLLTEDRMSMANSLEQRVPFLDKNLVEFAFSIPASLKYKNGVTKYILRKAMEPYLPEKNIDKKKWGFTFNPYLQFQKDLKDKAEIVLTKDRIEADKLFNYRYIREILDSPPHPKMRWHYNYIWLLVGFHIWKDQFKVEH